MPRKLVEWNIPRAADVPCSKLTECANIYQQRTLGQKLLRPSAETVLLPPKSHRKNIEHHPAVLYISNQV